MCNMCWETDADTMGNKIQSGFMEPGVSVGG